MAPQKKLNNRNESLEALVLDDSAGFAEDCAAWLTKSAAEAGMKVDPTPASGKGLGTFVDELGERSRDFRDGKSHCEDPCGLDRYDLLIIDSDLRSAKEAGLASGLDLAYSARCFTDVGYIVVLNAFGENPFDLTLLGHRRSFADLHLGSDQLKNRGLWKLDETLDFRPWNWPLLGSAAARLRERAAWLRDDDRLDEPIAELIGFDDTDLESIPRSMASFLTAIRNEKDGPGKSLESITPVDFLLTSEYGLLRRDSEAVEEGERKQRGMLARTAAARLSKWINVLVGGQDILVDAPHMASRFPSVLREKGIDDFDQTAQLEVPGDAAEVFRALGMNASPPLEEHFFDLTQWSDRPLWWGQRLGRSDLPEAAKPWEFRASGFAFCEDASRFLPEADAEKFACDLETPHRIRHLAKRDDEVTYRPRENLVTF